MKVRIKIGSLTLLARFFDTECAKEIYEILPLVAPLNEWGDEFYFQIPKILPPDETATEDVNVGDIGYWPEGHAIAIFFGPTPISEGDKPRPISRVNIIGRIIDDPNHLKMVKGSKEIILEKA